MDRLSKDTRGRLYGVILNCLSAPRLLPRRGEIKSDFKELRQDHQELHQDNREIRGDHRELRSDFKELKGDRRELRGDIKSGAADTKIAQDRRAGSKRDPRRSKRDQKR